MIDNQYKQQSFDFEMEDNLKSPFNNEIELKELKDRYKAFKENIDSKTRTISQNHFFFFYDIDDLLMFSPFLSNYIEQEEEDFIKLCSLETSEEEKRTIDLKYKLKMFTTLDYITKDNIEEISQNPNFAPYKFLVSFYYIDPFESFTDKISYILSLDKMEYPKKFVYDLINRKEKIRDGILSPMDKELLHFRFNEEEAWTYRYKPLLKNYHTTDGLKAIKKYYDSIPKVDKDFFEEHNEETTYKYSYKEFHFVYDVLLNTTIQERALRDPSIIDYETILKDKITRLEDRIKQEEDTFSKFDTIINNNLLKFNETIESLINKKINAENLRNQKELFLRDNKRLRYYAYSRINSQEAINKAIQEDNMEDITYIKNLETSPIESLDYTYYLILLKNDTISTLNRYRNTIKSCKNRLAYIHESGTLEAYYQEQAKIFFSNKYHKRDNSELIEQKERDKGNIASFSNNLLNVFKMDALSLRKLTQKEEEDAKKTNDNIKTIEETIKENESIIKNFSIDSMTKQTAIENLPKLEQKLATAKKEKSDKGYISYKDRTMKASYTIGSAKTHSISLEDQEGNVFIKYENGMTIKYPKFIPIYVLKSNKIEIQEKSLEELTDLKAMRLNVLANIIIDKASNTRGNAIELDLTQTLKDIGFKDGNTKKAREQLRYLLGILRAISISGAKIKTKDIIEKSKGKIEAKSTSLDILDISLISGYTIKGNSIVILLGGAIGETTRKNNSKIWKAENIQYKNPEERLIEDKVLSVMNQATPQSFRTDGSYSNSKTINISTAIGGIHDLSLKIHSVPQNHFKRDVSEKVFEYLMNINKNKLSSITFSGENLEKIPYMTTKEELEGNITASFREGCIPQKIKYQEETMKERKTKEKKKKGGK